MGQIETIWSLRKPFQMSGLECWVMADGTDDPAILYDQSINGRDMTVVSNEPELQQNIINGLQSL
jgi:hypothetical protein